MIAQPDRHYEHQTLCELLDEELPREQAEQVESHLGQCESCRDALEEIAGQRHWWDETVEVLSESTVAPKSSLTESRVALRTLDRSLDWIRPLLDDSTADGIGAIDKYPVQDVIGQGGMGVVLRGIDLELNRPVAIKVLSPHLAGVGAARARFMREARAAAAIVHPSIVPIYSIVPAARLPYIVMPCINGGNLQQRLDREGPLEIAEVLRIGLQIAEGLAAAHRNGVIHRDIKPANILIEEGNGRVLISDFGLARALDDATLTISGMIAGTPQYMSPEQARGEPTDARTDLFSLGSLLYALATGRPPFRAESPLAVLRKISETRPRPIHQINERVPVWFDALVTMLMRTDVNRRIATAEDVSELLREAHSHVCNPSSRRLPKSLKPFRHRIGWITAAALLTLLTTITAVSAAYLGAQRGGDASTPNVGAARGGIVASVQPADDAEFTRDAWWDAAAEAELLAIQVKISELAIELDTDVQTTQEVQPDPVEKR
jgi:serine/threonine protein kinase